jgi:hypothetical protein
METLTGYGFAPKSLGAATASGIDGWEASPAFRGSAGGASITAESRLALSEATGVADGEAPKAGPSPSTAVGRLS